MEASGQVHAPAGLVELSADLDANTCSRPAGSPGRHRHSPSKTHTYSRLLVSSNFEMPSQEAPPPSFFMHFLSPQPADILSPSQAPACHYPDNCQLGTVSNLKGSPMGQKAQMRLTALHHPKHHHTYHKYNIYLNAARAAQRCEASASHCSGAHRGIDVRQVPAALPAWGIVTSLRVVQPTKLAKFTSI